MSTGEHLAPANPHTNTPANRANRPSGNPNPAAAAAVLARPGPNNAPRAQNARELLRTVADRLNQRAPINTRQSRDIFLNRVQTISLTDTTQNKIREALATPPGSRDNDLVRWVDTVQKMRDDVNFQMVQQNYEIARKWWYRNDRSKLTFDEQEAIRRDGGLEKHLEKLRRDMETRLGPILDQVNAEVARARDEADKAGAWR